MNFVFAHDYIEFARNFAVTFANLIPNQEIKQYALTVTHINADAALKFNNLIEKSVGLSK